MLLTSLLPGLRELRTPLAAGYVWLACIWVALGDALPRARPESGPLALAWDAAGWLGASVVLAVLSFSAYLIGSFFAIDVQTGLPASLAKRVPPRLADRVADWRRRRASDQELRLRERIATLADQAVQQGWSRPDEPAVFAEITAESRALSTMLLKKNERLFDQYDRLQAEADYRVNLALPLGLLSIILGLTAAPPLLLGVPVAVIIAYQGTVRLARARDVLIVAIQTNEIDTAGLAELKRRATEPPPPPGRQVNTSEGMIGFFDDGTAVLPNGDTVRGREVLTREALREDDSVVPVGSLRFPDGRLLVPPWTGQPEPPQILHFRDGKELHPDGREYLRAKPGETSTRTSPGGVPAVPSTRVSEEQSDEESPPQNQQIR